MVAINPEVRAFLDGVHFAVAATLHADGRPHQTVVWYALEGDELILNTPQGSLKQRHLERDPRLSVCVEDGYQYVTLTGTASLEPDPDRAAYGKLGQRYAGTFAMQADMGPPPPGSRMAEMLTRDRVIIRMRIEAIQANGMGM